MTAKTPDRPTDAPNPPTDFIDTTEPYWTRLQMLAPVADVLTGDLVSIRAAAIIADGGAESVPTDTVWSRAEPPNLLLNPVDDTTRPTTADGTFIAFSLARLDTEAATVPKHHPLYVDDAENLRAEMERHARTPDDQHVRGRLSNTLGCQIPMDAMKDAVAFVALPHRRIADELRVVFAPGLQPLPG